MKNYLITLLLSTIWGFTVNAQVQSGLSFTFEKDSLYSKFLNEKRYVAVYLPAGYSLGKSYSVIYAADGQLLLEDGYGKLLDSLNATGKVKDFILVAAYSNELPLKGVEYRNFEYVKSFAYSKDSVTCCLFQKHLNFFMQELIPFVEATYGASQKPEDRLFYGFSNGGGFGITLSILQPLLIRHYICFSIAGADYKGLSKKKKGYPCYVLAYGNQEMEPFIDFAADFSKMLGRKGYTCSLHAYDGGHERVKWRQEFIKALEVVLAR